MNEDISILLDSEIIQKVNYRRIPPFIYPTTMLSKDEMRSMIIFSEHDLLERAILETAKQQVLREICQT